MAETGSLMQSGDKGNRARASWHRAVVVGILMASVLFLLWFTACVVLPAVQVRNSVERCSLDAKYGPTVRKLWTEIENLGGQDTAARKVRTYLRLPDSLAPRKELAVAIARECGTAGVPVLVGALQHHDERVRFAAADALGRPEASGAIPHLIAVLRDSNEEDRVRGAAAGALVEIGDPAVDPLAMILEDENVRVRRVAVWAIREIGKPPSAGGFRALEKALKDRDDGVRKLAREAIEKIQGN